MSTYNKPGSKRPSYSSGSKPAGSNSRFSSRTSTSGPRTASRSTSTSSTPRSSFTGSKTSFSSRPTTRPGSKPFGRSPYKSGSSRPSSNRGGRGGKKSSFERIDVSRFISKATIVEKEEIYLPTHTFADFNIDPRLKAAIAHKQYIYPSPIQDKSIPHALEGRDILGIANTGTGKTAAFLIPIINKILLNNKETAIIIAPTRELALQIEKEFNEFAVGMKMWAVSCVGGAPIFAQIKNLRRGCNLVIGTPGRLLDLVKRGEIDLSTTRNVVLDEADRMLDMGFIDDITFLLEKTANDRQTFLFSATLPKPIEVLISRFTKDPVRVIVKTRDTSKNVEQDVVRVARGIDKIDVLCELLSNSAEFKKVIIFSEMKHAVEKLSNELVKRGFKANSIHGDKRHNERQRALKAFKEDQIDILVATDVAARGLDIPDVTHVINYEIPQTYDTYVHRIGRTGRASKKGVALTFVS
ncbi:DEAD/DEAH box helicase [Candidatus Nomurabacteria bacterium]|nr:DEAD/DEAH box helicase [Candidatus Nomurabacteria bacterium]